MKIPKKKKTRKNIRKKYEKIEKIIIEKKRKNGNLIKNLRNTLKKVKIIFRDKWKFEQKK